MRVKLGVILLFIRGKARTRIFSWFQQIFPTWTCHILSTRGTPSQSPAPDESTRVYHALNVTTRSGIQSQERNYSKYTCHVWRTRKKNSTCLTLGCTRRMPSWYVHVWQRCERLVSIKHHVFEFRWSSLLPGIRGSREEYIGTWGIPYESLLFLSTFDRLNRPRNTVHLFICVVWVSKKCFWGVWNGNVREILAGERYGVISLRGQRGVRVRPLSPASGARILFQYQYDTQKAPN